MFTGWIMEKEKALITAENAAHGTGEGEMAPQAVGERLNAGHRVLEDGRALADAVRLLREFANDYGRMAE